MQADEGLVVLTMQLVGLWSLSCKAAWWQGPWTVSSPMYGSSRCGQDKTASSKGLADQELLPPRPRLSTLPFVTLAFIFCHSSLCSSVLFFHLVVFSPLCNSQMSVVLWCLEGRKE